LNHVSNVVFFPFLHSARIDVDQENPPSPNSSALLLAALFPKVPVFKYTSFYPHPLLHFRPIPFPDQATVPFVPPPLFHIFSHWWSPMFGYLLYSRTLLAPPLLLSRGSSRLSPPIVIAFFFFQRRSCFPTTPLLSPGFWFWNCHFLDGPKQSTRPLFFFAMIYKCSSPLVARTPVNPDFILFSFSYEAGIWVALFDFRAY